MSATETNTNDADGLVFEFSLKDNEEVHPRSHQFKSRGEASQAQHKRRKTFLEMQKTKRYDSRTKARLLAMGPAAKVGSYEVPLDESTQAPMNESPQVSTEAMETDKQTPTKRGPIYRDQLMLSEPLVDIPHDLTSDWFVSSCPTGKRCLVVSSKRFTVAYLNNGSMFNKFESSLPGGGPFKWKPGDYCILDCIYYEPTFTYYVLDLICWKGYSLYDCDTEFRFYWKMAKLSEVDVATTSDDNPYKFLPLPHYECSKEGFEQALVPSYFPKDTLLFYNKQTHYTPGDTPLVCSLDIRKKENVDTLQAIFGNK